MKLKSLLQTGISRTPLLVDQIQQLLFQKQNQSSQWIKFNIRFQEGYNLPDIQAWLKVNHPEASIVTTEMPADDSQVLVDPTLDPSCYKYCDLIGQSRWYKSHITLVNSHINS